MLATVCHEAHFVVRKTLRGLFYRSPEDGQQLIIENPEKDILLLAINMLSEHMRLLSNELGEERWKVLLLAHECLEESLGGFKGFMGPTESWAGAGPHRLNDIQVFRAFNKLEVFVEVPVGAKLHRETGVALGKELQRKRLRGSESSARKNIPPSRLGKGNRRHEGSIETKGWKSMLVMSSWQNFFWKMLLQQTRVQESSLDS
jgi:hypothetical protein